MVRTGLLLLLMVAGAMTPAPLALAQEARSAADAAPKSLPLAAPHCVSADRAPANAARLSDLRRSIEGDIVRASICNQGGVWTYRITVLQPSGQVRTLVFDAASGTPLGR